VRSVSAARLEPKGESIQADDNVSVTLTFANGSVGTVLYTAAGGASMPKEQVQALAGTRSALLNNFRSLDLYSGRKRTVKGDGDKGHAAQFDAFVRAVREGREAPVPLDQALNSSLATLLIYRALGDGTSVRVEMPAIESGGGEDS
jgi:predicted dehydrogenase